MNRPTDPPSNARPVPPAAEPHTATEDAVAIFTGVLMI